MPFIEAPTTFYLGRRFDPTTRRLVDEVIYYDSRDLTTHAVVVGMTGSGKTGLCVTLLEEAVMDNIPSIIIDPKGDITNLMLAFPNLQPSDFEPWINEDDARRAGLEPHAYAQEVAKQWREGLAGWGISPQRVQTFKQSARFSVYTPGSDAGLPISILEAMQAPVGGWQPGDDEFHRERINGIVTALLALIGKDVEPVKDKEHVLIANIFEMAWRRGQGLTLEDIIVQVQNPPFTKLGVFDVDTVFPEKARFALAMDLNNILASPSFQSWVQGEPLDIQSLLYTPEGKPRVSVFYIAHLNDAERMFIVTLLLENMLAWMRTLSGTTSLRALLYFDEVFGFFPPHPYNPPSKEPVLRLLKQARAFGLGLVLATQNPGDIDYKGLANAGTWFIGKLQTENDKNKVLSGLQSLVRAEGGLNLDNVNQLLSSIGPRVFVMHNVHNSTGPIAIHTRWAMSFLRGPLTRQQVRTLMADQKAQPYYPSFQQQHPSMIQASMAQRPPTLPDLDGPTLRLGTQEPPVPRGATPPPLTLPELPQARPAAPQPAAPPPSTLPDLGTGGMPNAAPSPGYTRPVYEPTQAASPAMTGSQLTSARRAGIDLPPGYDLVPPPLPSSVAQYYLPPVIPQNQALAMWAQRTGMTAELISQGLMAYESFLLAQLEVRYADRKSGISLVHPYAYHVMDVPAAGLIRWEECRAPFLDPRDFSQEPFGDAAYGALDAGLTDPKRMTALRAEVIDYLYKAESLVLVYNPELGLYSQPGMTHRDFLVLAQNMARQKRDEEIDRITAQYEKIFDRLEGQLNRAARDLASDRQALGELKNEELFTAGEAALSLLRGRTTYTLSRVSRTRRYKGQARENVYEAEQTIAELERQLDETQRRLENDLRQANDKWLRISRIEEEYRITPLKKDIHVTVFGIGWKPHWLARANGQLTLLPAWGVMPSQPPMLPPQQTGWGR